MWISGIVCAVCAPFAVGFLLFWVSLVILGTFLRGPNWSFFGPFEYWDIHKLEPMVNVGTHRTEVLDDQWTVVTADRKRSAHSEFTVAITAPTVPTGIGQQILSWPANSKCNSVSFFASKPWYV